MLELNGLPFQLAKRVEPGLGFQVGEDAFDFVPAAADESGRVFKDPNAGLRMHVRVDVRDSALVVSSSLSNEGSTPVSGINRIDPLHLVFRNSSEAWRHIYAHGGTTESYYPPLAYRTFERTLEGRSLRIESHPAGRSSNLNLPFLLSLASRSPRSEGLFCGIEWSGGWHITFAKVDKNHSSLSVGVKLSNVVLAPGEVFEGAVRITAAG